MLPSTVLSEGRKVSPLRIGMTIQTETDVFGCEVTKAGDVRFTKNKGFVFAGLVPESVRERFYRMRVCSGIGEE